MCAEREEPIEKREAGSVTKDNTLKGPGKVEPRAQQKEGRREKLPFSSLNSSYDYESMGKPICVESASL